VICLAEHIKKFNCDLILQMC